MQCIFKRSIQILYLYGAGKQAFGKLEGIIRYANDCAKFHRYQKSIE